MAVEAPLPAAHLPIGVGSIGTRVPPQKLQWLRPTPKDAPLAEMRHRLQADGYLFVKNVIPREDVLDIREWYFSRFSAGSLLEPSASPRAGIYNSASDPMSHLSIGGGLPAASADVQALADAHKDPTYRAFLEHDALRSMVRRLMGWKKETLLTRTMLRHNVPGGESTAVHYDKLFLRASPAFFLTAWVPLGDVGLTGGGLIYLQDAVPLGQALEEDFGKRSEHMSDDERRSAFNANMMANGMLALSPEEFEGPFCRGRLKPEQIGGEHTWLVSGYEAGDVVFHDPFSIHASSKNEDPLGRIRLSTDLRFYDAEGDKDERWMNIWDPQDGL